ncbi:MAG: CRISPR-associated protein Cas4 [Terracidiphilus sp.]|nr:CRISPR-associated protein Cas4 [Terracidiphilus sp.]
MYDEEDLLPLSGLQHLSFCPRRWALVHLERQWADNTQTAEGELLHERAHSAAVESRPGVLIRRTLPLRSLRLGLSGQADVVEFLPCAGDERGIVLPRRKGVWRPLPIEYKRSRDRHGEWAYRIQLCAQALCLEEMLGIPVAEGAIFDGQRKRRDVILFDDALRERVASLAAQMHSLFEAARTPPPDYSKKCEGCSMKNLCAPTSVTHAHVANYLRRNVDRNLNEEIDTSCENC